MINQREARNILDLALQSQSHIYWEIKRQQQSLVPVSEWMM